MSFSGGGSGSGGKSFGRKGFSPSQKKEKKKKQEFHRHKLKLQEEEKELDFNQLKERVSVSLDKLGHQVFSIEPGGYSFHNWMTSFNMLLDDFEEKAGSKSLPNEYYKVRQKLTSELLEPVDTSALDSEAKQIESEIETIRRKIFELSQTSQERHDKERSENASKIDKLKQEQMQSDRDLENAKLELEKQKNQSGLSTAFKKFFSGRSSASSQPSPSQNKLDSLKAKREEVEQNLRKLRERDEKMQRGRNGGSRSDDDNDDNEERKSKKLRTELQILEQKLGELESKKLAETQLTEKRIEMTKRMSEVICSIQLKNNDIVGEPAQPVGGGDSSIENR